MTPSAIHADRGGGTLEKEKDWPSLKLSEWDKTVRKTEV